MRYNLPHEVRAKYRFRSIRKQGCANGFDELDGAWGVDTFVIGDKTYAIVTGYHDDGFQVIDLWRRKNQIGTFTTTMEPDLNEPDLNEPERTVM